MGAFNFIKNTSARIQTPLSMVIKIILIFSVFHAIYFHLWHILFADIFLLFLTFFPYITRKTYNIYIPKEFEVILLAFIGISFFLGDIRGMIIQMFFGGAIGLIGFISMLILYSNNKIKKNYILIMIFSFSLSMTIGLGAEMIKYYLKLYLGYPLNLGEYSYMMANLTWVSIGAFLSSITGYFYMKGHRFKFLLKIANRFKETNPNIFVEQINTPKEIIELIKLGESEKLEFKSTLRTNLHTHDFDKKIEIATLKTITAFLNSEGGILLIGVDDAGRILGIEKDRFQSYDKFNLHFTNLIKNHIGNEFVPYISYKLITMEKNKTVLMVQCLKANKKVFLKSDGKEEFYIRIGPSSVQITGSKLVEYIEGRFKK